MTALKDVQTSERRLEGKSWNSSGCSEESASLQSSAIYGAPTLRGSDRGFFYGRRINLQHCSSPVILNFGDFPRSVTADAEGGGLRSGCSRTELRLGHRGCEEETLKTRKTVKETYFLYFYEAPLPRQSDSVLIDLQIIFSSPSIK